MLYVKRTYNKDKIILSGHSWGSILGLLYAQKHPGDLLCYIGCGQIVDMRRGERLLLDRLLSRAQGNRRDLHLLQSLGDYPAGILSADQLIKTQQVLMKLKKKYGMGLNTKAVRKIAMKSSVFRLSDLFAMLKAQKPNSHLYKALMDFRSDETTYDVPIFFMHGGVDSQVPLELAKEYLDRLSAPAKGFYEIENAGHIVYADNLPVVQSATREILARVR